MCLVFIGLKQSEAYPLVVAFNRDEVYDRKTRAAHWWPDAPNLLGGRDLERHGTWAGVTREGRIAMLTFVRTAQSGNGVRSRRSRGAIVADYLRGVETPETFIGELQCAGAEYLPFNIIIGDLHGGIVHYTNVDQRVTLLVPGVHGLSNATLNTPWPKVQRGCAVVAEWLAHGPEGVEALFALMAERAHFPDPDLPQSGVPLARERTLSSLFVEEGDYGTRTTTVMRVDRTGGVELIERTHPTPGDLPGEVRVSWR